MPNLKPAPDTPEHLKLQLDLIRAADGIAVYPYGTITMEQLGKELSDMQGMAPDVIAFSDDGRGVQNEAMMREAMMRAKALGNQRSSTADKAILLTPPVRFTLEEALEYIQDDELVEVTPHHIRLRKRLLSAVDRKKEAAGKLNK
jgi:predicted membrane GTPase involved in stress response